MALEQDTPLTIEQVMREGAKALTNSESPLLDARILMKLAAQVDDAGLIAISAKEGSSELLGLFDELIARRAEGEPVAYITGIKEFWSMEFGVSPGVLIPRDDSECLVETILKRRTSHEAPLKILDLGTGSGCLLAALLSEFPSATGVGVDASEVALRAAKSNLSKLGLISRAQVIHGDWGKGLTCQFDIIVANPPYIPETKRPHLSRDVASFEPGEALFAGRDGLDDFYAIMEDLIGLLAADGLVVFEAGEGQHGVLEALLGRQFPQAKTGIVKDLKGAERAVFADNR